MDSQALSAMRFSASRWVSHLTWPWMVAAGLLVFSSGMFLSVVLPAQRELATLRKHLSSLQKEVNSSEKSAAALSRNATPTQLAAFYNHFPAEQALPDWLEKILSASHENHLLLKQGDYRVALDKGGKLLRYRITLPINGSYLNIRKFLSAVLIEIPSASLDNVKFERQKIGDKEIEANIELTLYFRRAS